MPFKSKAQARWMFANKPKMAKEWADKTNFANLPNHKTMKKYPKPKYPGQLLEKHMAKEMRKKLSKAKK